MGNVQGRTGRSGGTPGSGVCVFCVRVCVGLCVILFLRNPLSALFALQASAMAPARTQPATASSCCTSSATASGSSTPR